MQRLLPSPRVILALLLALLCLQQWALTHPYAHIHAGQEMASLQHDAPGALEEPCLDCLGTAGLATLASTLTTAQHFPAAQAPAVRSGTPFRARAFLARRARAPPALS